MTTPNDAAAVELARRFPGVVVWFGASTRRWWAMVPAAERLIEAERPDDLCRVIAAALCLAHTTPGLDRPTERMHHSTIERDGVQWGAGPPPTEVSR